MKLDQVSLISYLGNIMYVNYIEDEGNYTYQTSHCGRLTGVGEEHIELGGKSIKMKAMVSINDFKEGE